MAEMILVVDDETEIADLVEVYLKNEGYLVKKASCAAEALHIADTQPIALALLDVMLPDLDGFTLSGFAYPIHSVLGHALPTACSVYPSVSPLRSYDFRWYWNLNQLSIAYDSRPWLRPRLTLGRLPLPRKPRVFGEYVFHIFYRYSCQHNHFTAVQHAFRHTFSPQRTLPYPIPKGDCQSFGTMLSPVTFSAQSH